MAWDTSRRRRQLPKDWPHRRAHVLKRDRYTCQLCQGRDCGNRRLEVDHIGDPNDHSYANLRTLGHDCHAKRTAQQAQAAKPKLRRPPEPHPGLRP